MRAFLIDPNERGNQKGSQFRRLHLPMPQRAPFSPSPGAQQPSRSLLPHYLASN